MLEMHHFVLVANQLGLEPPADSTLLDEILTAGESTKTLHAHLRQLLTDLGDLNFPFLIPCEMLLYKIGCWI